MTAARAMIKIVSVFIISVVFVFNCRCLCAGGWIQDISRAQKSVEREAKSAVAGSGHTAGGEGNESEEPGAIPRKERDVCGG